MEVDVPSKSDKDDVYKTQGGYLAVDASDDDFWGENEEDFWVEKTKEESNTSERMDGTKPKRVHNRP